MFLDARKGSRIYGLTNQGIIKKITKMKDGRKFALIDWTDGKKNVIIALDGYVFSSKKGRELAFLFAEREENIRFWNLAEANVKLQQKRDVLPL